MKRDVSDIRADDLLCLFNTETKSCLYPLKPDVSSVRWDDHRRNGFNGKYPVQIDFTDFYLGKKRHKKKQTKWRDVSYSLRKGWIYEGKQHFC